MLQFQLYMLFYYNIDVFALGWDQMYGYWYHYTIASQLQSDGNPDELFTLFDVLNKAVILRFYLELIKNSQKIR